MDNINNEDTKVLRTRKVELRLTEDEYMLLQSKKNQPQLAKWLRELALGQADQFTKIDTVVEKTIPLNVAIEFSKIGSNINQIARALNTAIKKDDYDHLYPIAEECRNILIDIEQHMRDCTDYLLSRD